MIFSSASDAHGRHTSSSKVLPRPRHLRSAMKAGHRSHRCSDDSSSSAQSWQMSVSDIPVICCQRRRWGWCPQRNRMRSVRSAFWRRASSSSSRGRVMYKAVKRGWVSDDCLCSRRMSAARVKESWVELLQSRVSLLNQLARCREGCSARAPTGFELLSSCRARRLLTVFGARRHRVGQSSQVFRPGTCCRRAPAPIANPRTHLATRMLSPSLISPLGTSCSIGGLGHAIVR